MIYSANYGSYEPARSQPVPVRTYTSEPVEVSATYDLHPVTKPRLEAKFWKCFPELACPDAEVTVWIDGSMTLLIDDLEERALAELGGDDALFMRHPWRDDIYEEQAASVPNVKYDGQFTLEQVTHYQQAGHPAHWGLVHSGLLVRRNTERMRLFDEAWWQEIREWSIQDQLSLPYLMRTMDLRWHYWPTDPITAGWVQWGAFNLDAALVPVM